MDEWIQLTSRTDRSTVWLNMAAATLVAPDGSGARISLQGRDKEVYVAEAPEQVMSRRAQARATSN
jgi:hypothetical protein